MKNAKNFGLSANDKNRGYTQCDISNATRKLRQ